jgi:hypothetical protein
VTFVVAAAAPAGAGLLTTPPPVGQHLVCDASPDLAVQPSANGVAELAAVLELAEDEGWVQAVSLGKGLDGV